MRANGSVATSARARFLLPALGVLALAAGPERLAPRPEAERVTTTRFRSSSSAALTERRLAIGGEEHPMDLGDREQRMGRDVELVFVDAELAVADGRVTKLRRTFEEVSGTRWSLLTGGDEDLDEELALGSALEGAGVDFTWDGEAEEYAAAWAEGSDGDEDLLAGLTAVLDLAALLPDEEVEEGDTWELAPEVLEELLRPLGELGLRADDDPPFAAADEDAPRPEYEGEVAATWRTTREEDGARLASIELELEVEHVSDTTEAVRRVYEERGPRPGMRMPEVRSAESRVRTEGGGTLVWDLTAGAARSLELELETAAEDEVLTVYGEGSEVVDVHRFEGTRTIALERER